jgi:hypothetical protein
MFTGTLHSEDATTSMTAKMGPSPILLVKGTVDPFLPPTNLKTINTLIDGSFDPPGISLDNIERDCNDEEKLAKFKKDIDATLHLPNMQKLLTEECPDKPNLKKYNWNILMLKIGWIRDNGPAYDVTLLYAEMTFKTHVAKILAMYKHNTAERIPVRFSAYIYAESLIE